LGNNRSSSFYFQLLHPTISLKTLVHLEIENLKINIIRPIGFIKINILK